ncbi:hypothetical protein AR505_1141 [methanogenic archaeon ISO4-H5]|nr:hypothetical protein AR505_1141 [methanogenic archaeon ISO4-H5]
MYHSSPTVIKNLSESVPVHRGVPGYPVPQRGTGMAESSRRFWQVFLAAVTSLSTLKQQKGHECTFVLRFFLRVYLRMCCCIRQSYFLSYLACLFCYEKSANFSCFITKNKLRLCPAIHGLCTVYNAERVGYSVVKPQISVTDAPSASRKSRVSRSHVK